MPSLHRFILLITSNFDKKFLCDMYLTSFELPTNIDTMSEAYRGARNARSHFPGVNRQQDLTLTKDSFLSVRTFLYIGTHILHHLKLTLVI